MVRATLYGFILLVKRFKLNKSLHGLLEIEKDKNKFNISQKELFIHCRLFEPSFYNIEQHEDRITYGKNLSFWRNPFF